MAVLITRPQHDKATHYLFHWAGEIVREAARRGIKCVDLARGKVKKAAVQSYLKKNVSDVVIINGHGSADCFCGHDDEVLVSIGDGDDLLKGKTVFVRACESGALLGPEIMKKGARGFVGYRQPYIFPFQEEHVHSPLLDEYAGPILVCSNQVALSMIKGRSATEAHEDSLEKYEEKIDELLLGDSTMTSLIPFLQWNRDIQVSY